MSRYAGIFLVAAAIFVGSPVHQWGDSEYVILLSERILRHGDVWLDEYVAPPTPASGERTPAAALPYQLEEVGGRVTHRYPHGSATLSLPFVAVLNWCGVSAIAPDGRPSAWGEHLIQALLAGMLMAGLAVVVYATCLLVVSPRWASVVTLGATLGTQVWSTASRALWSQTWQILLLGLVMLLLVGQARGGWPWRPWLLATLLCWAFFVRPLSALPLLGVGAYLAVQDRRAASSYGLACAAWLGLYVAYCLAWFGQPLPSYYLPHGAGGGFMLETFSGGLAGVLVSPSRGLLVYVPSLLFVGYALARYRHHLPFLPLVVLALGLVGVHALVVGGWSMWWGGHAYGSRLMTDVVPWLALLGLAAVRAMLDGHADVPVARGRLARRRVMAERLVGAGLLAASVGINARGALSWETHYWNIVPADVDRHPERLWDWSSPQLLGLRGVGSAPDR